MKNLPTIYPVAVNSTTRPVFDSVNEAAKATQRLERNQNGNPVDAYSTNDLEPVNAQTIYQETFEFKLTTPATLNSSSIKPLFHFNYWGKANQFSEQRITEGFTKMSETIEPLKNGWCQASCRFIVPEKVRLVRAFEIAMNKSDTSWEAIDICNHRIEKYRNLISFYLTFKPLPQGRTDILEVSGEQQGKLQDIKIIPDKEFGFCADFDGDKSYIEFATSQMPLKNEPYSIEVWIKPAEMKDCHIVGWGNSIGNNSANLLNLTPEGIRNSWGQTNTGKVAQKKLDDGQWHYVVATFDGKTRSIYVDSKELVKDDKLSQLAIADAQKLRIGKIDPAKLPAFKGKIALIRICGRSLTIDEIRRYHLLDKLNHITSPADPHLQLHLRLNELRQGLKPTTQEVQDFSGNERHGLVKENQPAPEVMADDRFGSCLNFKSTSGAISINSIPALPENKSFTIVLSVKVQPEEKQSDAIILQWGNDFKIVQKGNPWELTLTLQNNQKLTFDNSTNLTKFADGRWHQLAIIYNHQLPDISLYLDQIWVASKSIKLGAISSPLLEIAP